ncbi:MAG: acetyl-CoA carboxylase carboxyltransferase subunit alpha [Thermoleophilia bacterium]|jgi:acetyl-CoA carboxylase carboxyl transferase subunit alpha
MSVSARKGGRFVRRIATRFHGSGSESANAIWETIQLARHQDRPYTLDYIPRLFTEFEELRGDRYFRDDPSIVAGIARGEDGPYAVVGQQKGRDTAERTHRNFGMPSPEGYRKAMRVFELAEKLDLPVVTLIDTPGAFPGADAENRGQGGAISRSMQAMLRLRVPVVAVVIGEGSSGGALALGVADRVLMLENATYAVISPEGAASILWRDAAKARDAANAFQPTAANCYRWGITDVVVPEPTGGAHTDHDEAARILGTHLARTFKELRGMAPGERQRQRRERYRRIGSYREVPNADGTQLVVQGDAVHHSGAGPTG